MTTIGMIGTGRIGRLHAENIIRFSEAKIKAISDLILVKINRATRRNKSWGIILN